MSSQYKGKDIITGYYVYGPLFIDSEGNSYIDDIEAGCTKVYPETVELDTINTLSKGNVYGN